MKEELPSFMAGSVRICVYVVERITTLWSFWINLSQGQGFLMFPHDMGCPIGSRPANGSLDQRECWRWLRSHASTPSSFRAGHSPASTTGATENPKSPVRGPGIDVLFLQSCYNAPGDYRFSAIKGEYRSGRLERAIAFAHFALVGKVASKCS